MVMQHAIKCTRTTTQELFELKAVLFRVFYRNDSGCSKKRSVTRRIFPLISEAVTGVRKSEELKSVEEPNHILVGRYLTIMLSHHERVGRGNSQKAKQNYPDVKNSGLDTKMESS